MILQKKGLIKVNTDRVELPSAEYGCVYMAEFCDALAGALPPKDSSVKNYRRIYAPEGTPARPATHEPLTIHVVRDAVQGLLTSDTTLIVETGWLSLTQSDSDMLMPGR